MFEDWSSGLEFSIALNCPWARNLGTAASRNHSKSRQARRRLIGYASAAMATDEEPKFKSGGTPLNDFTNLLSVRKQMECLKRLGYDIRIKVRPASERVGRLTLAK